MNKLNRFFLLGTVMALVMALSFPIAAQEERPTGSGAPIILPNFGADIATLNPILSADGTSNTIISRIYPSFIGIDADTGFWGESQSGAIVRDWSISDDGLVYTFNLRDDYFWTDGTPVTSADVLYFWEAINDLSVNVSGSFTNLRDVIESIETPDDQTVVVSFFSPDCNAIDSAGSLQVVPAHVFSVLFPEFADMNDSPANLTPTVTGGPWNFLNFRPGEQVTLVANPDFPDASVVAEGWIYKNVADQNVQAEQFLAGQLTYQGVPTNRFQEFKDLVDAGSFFGHESSRANMRFMAMNLADPNNPLPGLDEDGNPIDQGLHPIFGDVRVRQALNYGMNFEEINQGVFQNTGIQMATHSRPDNWAHPTELEPYPFDQEKAVELLEEAGWVLGDDGIRVCQGCLYSTEVDASFEGSRMTFVLETNAGNTSQEALGVLLQDQWREIGVDVDFAPIDFNILVEKFTAQTYDAIMIFWGFGFPFDPDGTVVTFGAEADIPNSGFNAVSYYNPRVEEILSTARALPGCDQGERTELYREMYEILHDESPWIWIGVGQTLAVGQLDIEGWDPKPTASAEVLWNEESWFIAP